MQTYPSALFAFCNGPSFHRRPAVKRPAVARLLLSVSWLRVFVAKSSSFRSPFPPLLRF